MDGEAMKGGMCKCAHHKFLPWLMMLFGLLFLLGALEMVSMRLVEVSWPVLVILAGWLKLSQRKCQCCPGCEGGKCC